MAIVQRPSLRAALVVAAITTVVAGCGGTPSNSVKSSSASSTVPSRADAAKKVGKITLTVLDQETSASGEVEFPEMIKSFEKQYPNIKIKRLVRDYNSLIANETLLLSGNNVPDAVETDEGYSTQGRLAKAGLLRKLNPYANAWGWYSRTSSGFLACCRVQTTGKGLGTGPLYGFPANAQIVGLFYNQALLKKLHLQPPTTRAQFENALAKAKAAGMVPIEGAGDSPNMVWWSLYLAMSLNMPASQVRQALLGQGAGFDTPRMVAAANELASWGKKGYFEKGFGGVASPAATAAFAKGQALFYPEGSWNIGSFKSNPDLRYMPLPSANASSARMGIDGAGQPWGIPTKAKHPLAAALWIDWISDPANFSVFIKSGDLPIGKVNPSQYKLTQIQKDALSAETYMTENNTALPFFWAIPQTQNYWQGAGTGILSGHLSGQQFAAGMQSAWKQDVAKYGGGQ